MPRAKHYFEHGHFYHLTTRTLDGDLVFASEDAKQVVVDALAFYRDRGDWRIHAYVVMGNHIHVVVSETSARLSDIVRDVKKLVFRHLRGPGGGRLWERRFDDNRIAHALELRQVAEYIHGNPVRIGLARRPEDYFWSSARNYAGLAPVAMAVDTAW
ncbi:MAG: transposase [Acidobacteria bacterium]|nr:transposase [Acidobacteriota bacterium]